MVNSRQLDQIAAPIDYSLKNHIAEAIAAAMTPVTKTIEDQVNKSIDAMNESVKGVCTRQDFLCYEMKKLSGEDLLLLLQFDPIILRCNQFFQVDAVEEDQKVKLASMHLYDKALAWHRQYSKTYGEDVLWEVYVEALLKSGKLYSLEIVEDIRNYEDENGEQFPEGVFGYEDIVVKNRVGKPSGCERVLGVQWLATLGDIVCNFLKLRMEFNYQVCVFPTFGVQAEFISTCTNLALTNVHPCLSTLLQEYEEVFVVPNSLPPHRTRDHMNPFACQYCTYKH
nr:retrotransposable element Tf2 [Tanacetum cinerariifolium]